MLVPEFSNAKSFDVDDGWVPVVFAADCDEDGSCPCCGGDFGDCGCPGPTMEDEYEYTFVDGVMYAKRIET